MRFWSTAVHIKMKKIYMIKIYKKNKKKIALIRKNSIKGV